MKAVIFDMDGVIIDSEPIHLEVDIQTMKDLDCNISKEELNKYVGTTNEYMFTDIKNRYKINKSIEEIISYRVEIAKRKIIKSDLEPIEGIRELLKDLKNKNIPAAIASSSPRDFIEVVVSKFRLNDYFSYIVSGEEVANGKPAPDVYIETAKKLGIPPKDCIVIEDSKNGVLAAKAASMNCIGFQNINSGDQDLSKADFIVKSIAEIRIT
ncbi:2-deoxyglucose-6-phosphate phosphatase [Clostridium puniceum]|uniref:2-deoxyglucose-6-phosphate phosphatase n=1 Tax=Clostridium puniceum TaxID=29367 RepID=A0A1S8T9T2_9CLOT|nr:HAD family hydrolase [Clostridium puniceum]OOM74537.1 2-deoxyglucose-6-phosphate phosphatase [Clostridium puniceum]